MKTANVNCHIFNTITQRANVAAFIEKTIKGTPNKEERNKARNEEQSEEKSGSKDETVIDEDEEKYKEERKMKDDEERNEEEGEIKDDEEELEEQREMKDEDVQHDQEREIKDGHKVGENKTKQTQLFKYVPNHLKLKIIRFFKVELIREFVPSIEQVTTFLDMEDDLRHLNGDEVHDYIKDRVLKLPMTTSEKTAIQRSFNSDHFHFKKAYNFY